MPEFTGSITGVATPEDIAAVRGDIAALAGAVATLQESIDIMDLSISLSLGGTTAPPANAHSHTATINAIAVVPAFFDGGAARGVNAAAIPLSGTTDAPDGTDIEVRFVRADTSAEVVTWATVGTASGGTWSGTYSGVARNSNRLRAEVRVAGSSAAATQGTDDIIVGNIVVLIGQSEEAYMMSPTTDTAQLQAQRPTITDPDALHIITHKTSGQYPGTDYASNGILQITDATMYHTALGYMSNFLAANAPGERFLLVDAAVSGTSYWNLASDNPAASATEQSDRTWDGSFAGGIDLLRSYGAEPGLLMSTWTAAPATTSDGYRARLYPLYTGRYIPEQGGADYVLGTDPINSRPYDYLFFDLTGQGRGKLDPTKTMAYFYGPHRFELVETNTTKQDTRASIRNFVDDGIGHMLDFVGPEIISYESGFQATGSTYTTDRASANTWIDTAHPSKISVDGSPRRAQYTALAALYGLGIGPSAAQAQDVPEFNRAYWEPTGAYAEFWYEDSTGATPPISTTRLARALAAMPTTFTGTASPSQAAIAGAPLPHRAEVAGFEIDGNAAENVSIVSGRVRIYPNTGSFSGNTRIDFGRGGASGIHTVSGLTDADVIQADLFDKIWMNMPIVTGTVTGVEGVPLRPMPQQSDIGSTLASAPQFSATGQTYLLGPNWGASAPITVKMRLIANPASSAEGQLLRIPVGGGELKLSYVNFTKLRYTFAPAGLGGDIPSPLAFNGIMREFTITANPTTGAFGLYVDGVQVVAQASGTAGAFSGNYGIRLFVSAIAEVESVTIWATYSADGSAPATTPYKTIAGDYATALAMAKASPNPFTWSEAGVAQ